MRTLATIMVSISLVTTALFAHALVTYEPAAPAVVEQTASE